MDEEKLEHMLHTIQSMQNDVSSQTLNEYNQEIMSFQLSQEGLCWCIENFLNFQSKATILFALETFKTWIKTNWESITDEMINEFKQILFVETKLTFSVFGLNQASAQFCLFERLYPDDWPSFWEELLSLNPKIVMNFLQEFVSSNHESREYIISQMQIDNSEASIVQFVISKVEKGEKQAFPILTQMLEWIDPEPVLESSIISIIQNDLNNSIDYIISYDPAEENHEEETVFHTNINKLECAINVLHGLTNSDFIDSSTLSDLLSQFDIIDKMLLICQNSNFESIISTASNLISSCARIFSDSPDAPQYYQLSLQLLSHPSADVADQIITFIKDFTEQANDDEISQSTFQTVLNRFSIYFSTNPTLIDQFASQLLSAINNTIEHCNGLLDSYLTTVLESSDLNLSDPLVLSAMFYTLVDIVENHMPFEKQNEIAFAFSAPLLEEQQPPYDDHFYYAVTSYMTYLTRIASQFKQNNENQNFENDFPPETVFQAMFTSLMNNLLVEYEDEFLFKREKFVELANNFIQSDVFKLYVDVTDEHVFELIGTGIFEIITIASQMLPKFDEAERIEIFNNCMQLMLESIQSDEDVERQKSLFQSMIIMIKNQAKNQTSKNENSDISQSIMPYMEKILPFASDDGEIMTQFIDALYQTFGYDGLSLMLSIINDGAISDMVGLAKACEISESYINDCIKKNGDLAWVNDCVRKLFEIMSQMIEEVSDWTDISEETKEAVKLIGNFFHLISHCSSFLSEELNDNLLNFISEIFTTLFHITETKEPLSQSIDYLTSLAKLPDYQKNEQFMCDILINIFIPLTFQIYTEEEFILESGNWRKTIYSILNFHQILLKIVPEFTEQKICELFNQLQRSETTTQAMSEYIQQLQNYDPMKEEESIPKLYNLVEGVLHYIRQVLSE